MLVNLIGNAIKFTERGEIVVKATLCEGAANSQLLPLRISVRDTGIGIPEEKFKAIFDSFSQADTSTTRVYGGTGLGLSISARLVELMGGSISLESTLGKGSTFYIDIPIERAQGNTVMHDEALFLKNMRVLIVDDNVTNREIALELTQRWGMLPTAVEGGQQAIDELTRAKQADEPYELLLLDVRMPDMNGFSVIEELRAQHADDIAPVMMLTSEGQRGDAQKCRELGVSAYLLKPYTQSDLFAAIMNTLGLIDKPEPVLVTRHFLRESKHKLNVLLAEDNSVNQTLVKGLLTKFGHSIEVAQNGLEAVEKWHAGRYDLILMDVDMPVLNGYAATEQIRQSEQANPEQHIPIIGLTAHVVEGTREKCLAAGMDGYLSKPINIEALWRELNKLGQAIRTDEPPAPTINYALAVADFNKTRRNVDDDRAIFEKIVELFLTENPLHIQKIKQAATQNSTDQIRTSSHTLRGMLGIFAAEKSMKIAKEIEQQAGKSDVSNLADELVIAVAELEEALRAYQW